MNPIKALYCRTSQLVFWLAIPLLPYRFPKRMNSVAEIPAELRKQGVSSVLIVTDAAIHSYGLIDPLKRALDDSGIAWCIYDETVPNPTVQNVEEARKMYLEHDCAGIIAFGGVGESGMGAYHGRDGFETFSHRKSIVDKKTWIDLPMRYQPFRKLYSRMLHIFLR